MRAMKSSSAYASVAINPSKHWPTTNVRSFTPCFDALQGKCIQKPVVGALHIAGVEWNASALDALAHAR